MSVPARRRGLPDRPLTPVERLALLEPGQRERVVRSLRPAERLELEERWPQWAHEGQLPPEAGWGVCVTMAGRGFGKTRAGAEWVSEMARRRPGAQIALVGATPDEVRKVLVEGPSGLLATARLEEDIRWIPSLGTLTFASGAKAFVYSGANPEKLRGPEHDFAWCDELAKWAFPEATWQNLMLGLRLGDRPQALVTTTPRPIAALKRLVGAAETVVMRGSTCDNLNLADAVTEEFYDRHGGTRFGRQELDGELIDDVEGSLWPRDLIEKSRASLAVREGAFSRVVVGVDPPASAAGTCGIVVCALGEDGTGYVLADASVAGLSPEGWARAAAAAAARWGADRVVAEGNQGGAMVAAVLRGADVGLPVRMVHARDGKAARAEPVAALFERGAARFAGAFAELEDELAGLIAGGGYEGPGRSPDRADAMVWALTELMLGRTRPEPRITFL
ncbi:MAG TPA: terminase family protein [Allosphingosinicella sp.]